jgi:hypothetical protein
LNTVLPPLLLLISIPAFVCECVWLSPSAVEFLHFSVTDAELMSGM